MGYGPSQRVETDHTLVANHQKLHHPDPVQNLPMHHSPAALPIHLVVQHVCQNIQQVQIRFQYLVGKAAGFSKGFLPPLEPCRFNPVASSGCHWHLDIFLKKQCHCKHIAVSGGVALPLACIAYDVGVPCSMIMVGPCIPPTGGFAIIPCISPVMRQKKSLPRCTNPSIWQLGKGAPIYGTTLSPNLVLRPVLWKVCPKHLWEIKTLNPRCHGSAVIGMPFHLPCMWHNVPNSYPCILIHLCGQSHHAEVRGRYPKSSDWKVLIWACNVVITSMYTGSCTACKNAIFLVWSSWRSSFFTWRQK